jgi:pyruvate formate lyase activating enzyme
LSTEALFSFLQERKDFLEGVVLSGGEPTLAPELMTVCRTVKALGLALKLDTNGRRPQVLETLLAAGLVDYAAMDLKALPEDYFPHLSPHPCAGAIRESIRLLGRYGTDHEFRTTCAPPWVDGPCLAAMGQIIRGAPLWALQTLQTGVMRDPSFLPSAHGPMTEAEMASLHAIAAPFVQRCILR